MNSPAKRSNIPVVRHSGGLDLISAFFRTACLSLAMMVVTLTAAAFAQQPAPTDSKSTLTSSAELVLVPVQVRDSSGKPVRGLLQTDFILQSDGKIQPVKLFEEIGGDAPEPVAAEPSATPETPAGQEFSSVPNNGLPQELVVIAIDEINTPNADQSRARQELLKYFDQSRPGEFFTLVALTFQGLRQIQPFTSDPKVLLAALRQEQPKLANAELTHESRDVPNPGLCKLCGGEIDSYRSSANANALDATVQSFAQLEQAYAAFPGRKSVICFSSGLPDLEIISTILNRSNIALYPVDLKGVHGDLKEDPRQDIQYSGEEEIDVTTIKGMWVPKKPDNTDMHGVATRTGGRYCTSTAALQRCIASAVEDSSSYYLLGFYIPQSERVVGWHKLDVKLSSGHEKVHARSGYYLEAKSTPSEDDVRKGLLAAAQARIGYTGVAFLVERLAAPAMTSAAAAGDTPATSAAPSNASVNFRIRVPASSVMLDPGQQSLSYEIAMVPLTEKGEPASTVQTTRLSLNAQQTQQALAKGWRYDETLAQSNAVVAVKFLVRDNSAGKIGSVVVPLSK